MMNQENLLKIIIKKNYPTAFNMSNGFKILNWLIGGARDINFIGPSTLFPEYISHFEVILTCSFIPDKFQLNCHSHTKNKLHVSIHFWDIGFTGILKSDRLIATEAITQ